MCIGYYNKHTLPKLMDALHITVTYNYGHLQWFRLISIHSVFGLHPKAIWLVASVLDMSFLTAGVNDGE